MHYLCICLQRECPLSLMCTRGRPQPHVAQLYHFRLWHLKQPSVGGLCSGRLSGGCGGLRDDPEPATFAYKAAEPHPQVSVASLRLGPALGFHF